MRDIYLGKKPCNVPVTILKEMDLGGSLQMLRCYSVEVHVDFYYSL